MIQNTKIVIINFLKLKIFNPNGCNVVIDHLHLMFLLFLKNIKN